MNPVFYSGKNRLFCLMNSHDKDMPKPFVIQKHSRGDDVHWDFMLEVDDVLLTWRLNIPPAQITAHSAQAVRISDHPLRFLTYQGPVQNGAGRVRIVDSGVYRSANETADRIELSLAGRILNGPFVLERAGKAGWRLTPIKNQIKR